MHPIVNEFIRHAPQCVEKHVTRQASLNIPAAKVVQEYLHHVVEEMESLSIVCLLEKLSVR